MDEDPYRWCIYCHADCYADEPDHAPECPSTTGVFPVVESDLDPCENCGHERRGFCCMDCDTPFKVGDHYMHRTLEAHVPGLSLDSDIEVEIREVICIGCAAKGVLA